MNALTAKIPLIALLAYLTSSLPLSAQEGAWEIGARTLPPSVGVSEAFRQSQINTPKLDPAPMDFVPANDAQWLEHIEEKDAASAKVALAIADALNVTIKEDELAGVKVHWLTPPETDAVHQNHLFVYIHGGAYVYNGGEAGLIEPSVIAARLRMPVVSIDYRMPPSHPAPAASDDVIAVWKALLETRPSNTMVMGGTSAGANITLASNQRLVEQGQPVPAALYIGTPTVDLNAEAGDSRHLNEEADRILVKMGPFAVAAMNLYAGELGLDHPYVSPIFGDFANLPPSYLISGTRDLLLSDTVRAHRALRRAGVEAQMHIYEGQGHADYIVAMKTPESAEHYAELNRFVLEYLSTPSSEQEAARLDNLPQAIPASTAY
ncbi:alpha/beta hydrolase [Ferrimonas balearica]|uniref:alpha/beta hydrolase n=1 Tax=Ferrimonas balearica TaxID=44012 RepID=UPI001C94225E|nr:alpha/beta hydrolase [Ferrimonas balearica]MBY5980435.1 alpha/beta hydrolase [Ferrimonas balearica]